MSIYEELLPQHCGVLLVAIVMDNARSHGSDQQQPQPCVNAKRSCHLRRLSRKWRPRPTVSRWECGLARNDNIPLINKLPPRSLPFCTTDTLAAPSLCNVVKPVRRRSLEDAELLSKLHDSLSLLEEEDADDDDNNAYHESYKNMSAGEMIALALQDLDLSFDSLEERSSTTVSDLMETE